jgi:hypothetical protein
MRIVPEGLLVNDFEKNWAMPRLIPRLPCVRQPRDDCQKMRSAAGDVKSRCGYRDWRVLDACVAAMGRHASTVRLKVDRLRRSAGV